MFDKIGKGFKEFKDKIITKDEEKLKAQHLKMEREFLLGQVAAAKEN